MTPATKDPLTILREPFKAEQVGKLPKISCGKCSKSAGKCCGENNHHKAKCDVCKAWITTAHIHLDYVGHASVTDRLLQADPHWSWEPAALDEHGAPIVEFGKNEAVMWVRLTVGGVTRWGVGSAPVGSFEVHKQLVSDAIRNAAMRFGVALELWSKEPLEHELSGGGEPVPSPPAPSPGVSQAGEGTPVDASAPSVPGPGRLKALLAALPGIGEGRCLKQCRDIATQLGEPLPNSFDEITLTLAEEFAASHGKTLPDAAAQAGPLTEPQRKYMFAVYNRVYGGDLAHRDRAHNQRKADISRLTSGRTDSSGELTPDEAKALMDHVASLDPQGAQA